jgi:hypothetical protein
MRVKIIGDWVRDIIFHSKRIVLYISVINNVGINSNKNNNQINLFAYKKIDRFIMGIYICIIRGR